MNILKTYSLEYQKFLRQLKPGVHLINDDYKSSLIKLLEILLDITQQMILKSYMVILKANFQIIIHHTIFIRRVIK